MLSERARVRNHKWHWLLIDVQIRRDGSSLTAVRIFQSYVDSRVIAMPRGISVPQLGGWLALTNAVACRWHGNDSQNRNDHVWEEPAEFRSSLPKHSKQEQADGKILLAARLSTSSGVARKFYFRASLSCWCDKRCICWP